MSNKTIVSPSLKRESSFSTTNSISSDKNSDFQINITFGPCSKKLKGLKGSKTRFYYDAIDFDSEFSPKNIIQ